MDGTLTPEEEKEFEKNNMKMIEAVYDAIANDIEIQKQIEKINVVEGCE